MSLAVSVHSGQGSEGRATTQESEARSHVDRESLVALTRLPTVMREEEVVSEIGSYHIALIEETEISNENNESSPIMSQVESVMHAWEARYSPLFNRTP